MSLQVKKFICGPLMTNAYIVFDTDSKEGIILDPAAGSLDKILKYLAESEIKAKFILLTHSHWDHIADCKALQDKLGIEVFVHKDDKENLQVPGSDQLVQLVSIQGVDRVEELFEGKQIEVGEFKASVMHTPGHSPGGICLYFKVEKILFSGDTLFKGGHGTLDVPTAEKQKMYESLRRLKGLDSDTIVYCGHGASTTIGAEKWLEDF